MSSIHDPGDRRDRDELPTADLGHLADDTRDETPASYAALLREAGGRVPDDRIDWDGFHTRLSARAELSLARLRYSRHPKVAVVSVATVRTPVVRVLRYRATYPWWAPAARWARLVVTGSVAAGIALTVVVRKSPKEVEAKEPETVVAASIASSEALAGRRAAFESVVTGRNTSPTAEAALLPTATDLLIPLGKGVPVP